MAIEIKFLSNVVSFLRGTRDMSRALDDTQDTLEQSAREARRLGDMLGDEVADGARDGRSAVDKLRDSMRDLDRSTGKVADTGRDGFKRMGDNVGEFKSEAKQNFAEVASSFDGSVDDMVGGVQGLTGGLGAALTPGIGIPVAVIGAIAATFLTQWQTSTEESAENVSNMYRDMLESGQGFLTENYIQQAIADLADDTGKWSLALERSKTAGVDVGTVLRAMVGDAEAIGVVREAERDNLAEQLELINGSADSEQIKADKVDAANLKYAESVGWLDAIIRDTDSAASKAALVGTAWESAIAGAQRLRDKLAEVVRDMEKVGQPVTVKIDADTTGIDGALKGLQGRTISVNVNGQITRIGNQVWN
jgi:hypothetical protein